MRVYGTFARGIQVHEKICLDVQLYITTPVLWIYVASSFAKYTQSFFIGVRRASVMHVYIRSTYSYGRPLIQSRKEKKLKDKTNECMTEEELH